MIKNSENITLKETNSKFDKNKSNPEVDGSFNENKNFWNDIFSTKESN